MRYLWVCVLMALISIGCSRKYVRYILEDKEKTGQLENEYTSHEPQVYRLQAGDQLFLRLSSRGKTIKFDGYEDDTESDDNSKMGNLKQNNSQTITGRTPYFNDYVVNDSGFLYIPILGAIPLENKTYAEARTLIEQRASLFYKDVFVTLKPYGMQLTFLGEMSQGVRVFYQDRMSILEAIASMGGINDYGDKRNVLVVRKIQGGHRTYRLDLTQRKILESDLFYMQTNDIIIVEPVKRKLAQSDVATLNMYLYGCTSIITTVALFLSLSR